MYISVKPYACKKNKNKRGIFCLWLTFARDDKVLLLVQMVLVALDMAAAALQGWRGLEHVPQGLGASLTIRREMVEGGDELMAFVGQAVGLITLRNTLHVRFLPTLTLISIEYLKNKNIFFKLYI